MFICDACEYSNSQDISCSVCHIPKKNNKV